MSEKWYPVIDSEKCTNCGECIVLCNSGVFEVINDKVVVAYTEECIWECTKCESKCLNDSILYQFTV